MKITNQTFGYFGQIPVNQTIKKILIGKVFSFHSNKPEMIIVGVRRSNLYGYLEVLVGRFYGYHYAIEGGVQGEISIYSWYAYNPKHSMSFIGRNKNKQAIRNCVKKHPDKLKYHIGKHVDIRKCKIVDNCDYYKEYKKSVNY